VLGGSGAELVFNSGGTEGLNHVCRGVFEAFPDKRHFVITTVEHPAVQALAGWLRKQGAEVTAVPVAGDGQLDLDALEAALAGHGAGERDEPTTSARAFAGAFVVVKPRHPFSRRRHPGGGQLPLDLRQLLDLLPSRPDSTARRGGALFLRRGAAVRPVGRG
jgi:cysteine desulfurase